MNVRLTADDLEKPNASRWLFLAALCEFTAIVGCGLLFSLLAVGVPLVASVKIVVYVCVAFPPIGALVYHARLAGEPSDKSGLEMYLVLGLSLFPAGLFFVFVLSLLDIFIVILPLFYAVFIVINRNKIIFIDRKLERVGLYSSVLTASLIAPICVAAMVGQPSVAFHADLQAITAQSLSYGWPPESPFLGGVPLSYNYGFHLLLSSLSRATGMRMDALCENAAQTLALWLAIFGTFSIARYWLRLSIFSALSVSVAIFLVLGFSPIAFGWLVSSIPATGVMTLSPLLGHVVFLASGMALVSAVRDPRGGGIIRFVSFFLLGFSASFVRANSGALLASTSSAYWIYLVATRRRIEFYPTAYVFLIGIGSIIGVIFTLGLPGASAFSGAKFIQLMFGGGALRLVNFSQITVATLAREAGFSAMAAGILAFLFMTLFPAGFLSPIFWWRVWRMRASTVDQADVFLLLGFVLAFSITFLTDAPGGSQFVFQQTGIICACLIGGRGLDEMMAGIRGRPIRALRSFQDGLVVMTLVCGAIHLADALGQTIRLRPLERVFATQPYAGTHDKPSTVDIAPLLDQLGSLSNTYFLFPENKAISGIQVQKWMSAHGLRRVAAQDLLKYYEMYGHPEIIDRLSKSNGAFIHKSQQGVIDLNCAYDAAKASFVFDDRIVVLSSKTDAIVGNANFQKVAETIDISAWELIRRDGGGLGCAYD